MVTMGMVRKSLGWSKNWVISSKIFIKKQMCKKVRKAVVCPVVQLTGLGLLCLSER